MVYAVHCSKTDAGMIVRVIPMVPFMMEDINTNVIKRLLVCIVQLYKQAFAVRDSAGRNEGGGGRDGGYGFSLSFSRFSLCQRSKSLKKMYRRCGRYIHNITSAYYICVYIIRDIVNCLWFALLQILQDLKPRVCDQIESDNDG